MKRGTGLVWCTKSAAEETRKSSTKKVLAMNQAMAKYFESDKVTETWMSDAEEKD